MLLGLLPQHRADRVELLAEAADQRPHTAVVRRGHEQAPAGPQHPADLGEQLRRVRDEGEYLGRPDDVHRRVVDGQRLTHGRVAHVERGMTGARPVHRRRGHVDRDGPRARLRERRAE